jgi:hypothetical protein
MDVVQISRVRYPGVMSDLYENDILTWSERQAELPRRRATGEPVNDEDIDWLNVAEEIEDLGKSEVRAVRSHIVRALSHDLKAEAWPESREVPRWRAEARGHRDEARDDYVVSMAAKIDMAKLYQQVLRRMPDTIDGIPPLPVPTTCVVTLDELVYQTALILTHVKLSPSWSSPDLIGGLTGPSSSTHRAVASNTR